MLRLLLPITLLLTLAPPGFAAPAVTLRMATVTPDGTGWARAFKAVAREIEAGTHGEVRMKWYFNGIAGDDVEAARRIGRDQLDGVGTGVWQCERWVPSMKVTRLPGLFRNRNELKQVAARLRPMFEEDARKAGFVFLGEAVMGPSVVFLRTPVRSLDELRKTRVWSLDNDETKSAVMRALGLPIVTLPLDGARAAYESGQVDGFLAPPTGAIGFQWSTQARYLLDLTTDHLLACMVVTRAAFEALPLDHQAIVRSAVAKLLVRFNDESEFSDERLMGGLFQRQGLTVLRPDDRFKKEFQAASEEAWKKLETAVPPSLLAQVQTMLAALRKH
ncbi:MAG: C4-dicarboxylate transporter [Myxococcales bacterium]|nr:C4-dicarboxylate transporter [Myxococcales bacterium]